MRGRWKTSSLNPAHSLTCGRAYGWTMALVAAIINVIATDSCKPFALATTETKNTATSFWTISIQIFLPGYARRVKRVKKQQILRCSEVGKMSSFYLKTFSWSQAAKSVLHKQSLGTRNNAVTGSDILQNTPLCQHFTKTPALPGIIQAPNVRWFYPKHINIENTCLESWTWHRRCLALHVPSSNSDVLVIHSDPFSRNLHLPSCCCLACCLASSASMKLRRSGSKWSLAAFTEPSSGSMSALPSTTRNETWDLNMKMRKPMTSNEKQEMALVSSSLEFLNASQTPFRKHWNGCGSCGNQTPCELDIPRLLDCWV